MSQRDIAKSVKAQDFDSCISLVRVQLSLPRTSHPFGWLFSFVAGIVPTSTERRKARWFAFATKSDARSRGGGKVQKSS